MGGLQVLLALDRGERDEVGRTLSRLRVAEDVPEIDEQVVVAPQQNQRGLASVWVKWPSLTEACQTGKMILK